MKGDFSRFTFDPKKHYARVLMQQGRVQLDADWNEQVAMLLHRLETMALDLIGPFGGPVGHCGFSIVGNPGEVVGESDFPIGKGRYYVAGLLCENDAAVTYTTQQLRPDPGVKFSPGDYLVYLDAWEQYVNVLEDPDIREKALGGPDTAGRSQVVWCVRTLPVTTDTNCKTIKKNWDSITSRLQAPYRGLLSVKAEQAGAGDDSPCIVPPTARFRGLENQLYRVEIHDGGKASTLPAKSVKGDAAPSTATFKWSRENGSVVFPVASANGTVIVLEHPGGYSTTGLKIDDWVELIDDHRTAQGQPDPLLQVKSLDPLTVKTEFRNIDAAKHPYLRRWDQKPGPENKGGLTLHKGAAALVEDAWLHLEDGIQILFKSAPEGEKNIYRPGDFWYIPARTFDEGRIVWPSPVPPDGVTHRYAPLAILKADAGGKLTGTGNCAVIFDPAPPTQTEP